MNDSFNSPRTALVIGGTSEIAEAIVDLLAGQRLRHVVLASRTSTRADETADRLRRRHPDLRVDLLHFDAAELASHESVVDAAVVACGDVDLVIVACGLLGTPDDGSGPLGDRQEAIDVATATYLGPMSILHVAANRLYAQGHGTLAVISSVAALRPRRTNPPYGAAKAALDGFALALADRFHSSGVHVMVVRPGFVRTRMTANLGGKTPPMSTTPERVAADVIDGLRRRRRVVWSPFATRAPGHLARVLPSFVMRRMPW